MPTPKLRVVASGHARQKASVSPTRVPADDPRVAAAMAGESQAVASLCRSLLPRVRNLVRYLIRGDSDVEDFAQDAMIEILRSLTSFRGDSALSTWADRIVVRTTLHGQRRSRTRAERLREVASELDVAEVVSHGDPYLSRRLVVKLLDGLPEEQRSVLVLHHVLGMSVPEAAGALDIPFDTAKSRLRLAMAKLRKEHGVILAGSAEENS